MLGLGCYHGLGRGRHGLRGLGSGCAIGLHHADTVHPLARVRVLLLLCTGCACHDCPGCAGHDCGGHNCPCCACNHCGGHDGAPYVRQMRQDLRPPCDCGWHLCRHPCNCHVHTPCSRHIRQCIRRSYLRPCSRLRRWQPLPGDRAAGRAGRRPGRQRGRRGVRRGGASCLAGAEVRITGRMRGGLTVPRLQAAADGAAGVVVVECAARAALHIVHQALLLGLQLLIAHLQAPLILRQHLTACPLLHSLRVVRAQVQLHHVRGHGANDGRTHIAECYRVRCLSTYADDDRACRVKRRRSQRLWRRLARAPEAVAVRPVARLLPSGVHAAQSHQARPEEAQGASWGPAKGARRAQHAAGPATTTTPMSAVLCAKPMPSVPLARARARPSRGMR
eukprot:scaffold11521_cov68-Phaeocystis_antarctica.AAC.5